MKRQEHIYRRTCTDEISSNLSERDFTGGAKDMKIRQIAILLGGLALLIAAFLLINFRAAFSSTQAENNRSSVSIGDQMPNSMQRRDKITIIVEGDGLLARAIEKAVLAEFRKAGLENVELAQALTPTYPNPVLLIKPGNPSVIWTPFFATSQFAVQAGYASNGDTALLGDTPSTIDNRNGPALDMASDFKITDRSWGIISRPGYYQFLADTVAQNVVKVTTNLYEARK